MTDRQKILDQLSAYLDGELTPGEIKKVEQLLAEDAQVASELRKLQAVREMVADLPRWHAGEDFVSMVLAQVERRDLIGSGAHEHSPLPGRWVRWLAVAAVLLVAVGIGSVMVALLNPPTWPEKLAETDRPRARGQIARTTDGFAEDKIPPQTPPRGDVPPKSSTHALDSSGVTRDAPADKAIFAVPTAGEEAKFALATPAAPPRPAPEQEIPTRKSAKSGLEGAALSAVAKEMAAPAKAPEGDTSEFSQQLSFALGETGEPPKAAPAMPDKLTLAMVDRKLAKSVETAPAAPHVSDEEYVAKVIAKARREDLTADSIGQLQEEIEEVLNASRVVMLPAGPPAEKKAELMRRQMAVVASNYLQLPPAKPAEIQYLAQVTPTQMTHVVARLESIRARQRSAASEKGAAATQPAGRAGYVAIEEVDGKLRLRGSPLTAGRAAQDNLENVREDARTEPMLTDRRSAGVLCAPRHDGAVDRLERADTASKRIDPERFTSFMFSDRAPAAAEYQYLLITLQARSVKAAPAGK